MTADTGILGVIAQRPDSMRSVINVLITVATGSAVYADRIAVELFGAINPALVLIHRALAGDFITCVELVPGVHEDQYVFHALTGGALDEFTIFCRYACRRMGSSNIRYA